QRAHRFEDRDPRGATSVRSVRKRPLDAHRRGQHELSLTGAASGIGKATAFELARRGARAVLVDKDERGLAAAEREARADGLGVSTHVLDVADGGAVDSLAARLLDDGPIDVLVNNAGVAVVAPFARTVPADWEWILGVNLHGTLRLTRALL